ncbi:hypothetical protein EJB05_56240, partial [Eragrostis curvula]
MENVVSPRPVSSRIGVLSTYGEQQQQLWGWYKEKALHVPVGHRGSRVSLAKTKCQQADISEIVPVLELDELPEDVLHHIHSLVPLRSAARVACVSHKFLRSWRRFPDLTFKWETSGLNINDGFPKKLADMVHCVLGNHSGTGVKTLELRIRACGDFITANHLNKWLQSTVKSGISELVLDLPQYQGQFFNFSCLLLSRAANSLQYLSLSFCVFRPTPKVGCLRNLKRLSLRHVHITENELECFLSRTISLEDLEVYRCDMVTFLKVPSHLQQLSILRVFLCRRLNMIEIYAPKVSTFVFTGPTIEILVNDMSQLKNVTLDDTSDPGMFQYALTKLHSLASNLQTLTLLSWSEDFDMPTSHDKFHFLRILNICCSGIEFLNYDFLSFVSFLEACPVLETFLLLAGQHVDVRQDSILEDCHADSLRTRHTPEFHHDRLKKVRITGFSSAKSLVELTCHIVENSSSLEHLVLDTTRGYDYKGMCDPMCKTAVTEALKGMEAINRYVKGKVPSRVKFQVLEPCDRCHIPNVHADLKWNLSL